VLFNDQSHYSLYNQGLSLSETYFFCCKQLTLLDSTLASAGVFIILQSQGIATEIHAMLLSAAFLRRSLAIF